MKRFCQSWNGNVPSVNDGQYPHAVKKLNFLDERFKEKTEQVVVMPSSDCRPNDGMNELKLVSRWNLVYILVEKA